MRLIIILAFVVLLVGCAEKSSSDFSKEDVKQHEKAEQSLQEWIADLHQNSPEWFVCETRKDCTAVPAECGTTCRGDVVNSQYYSDFVVKTSKLCRGSGKVIKDCEYTETACENGVCVLKYPYIGK